MVFVGHFSPLSNSTGEASSTAGNQVQRQILKELGLRSGSEDVVTYSMVPMSAWPRGPLISRSLIEGPDVFPAYVNLPILKHMVFALRLLVKLIWNRPQLCLQYNSYLFENLTLLLYRLLRPSCGLVIFIQDIHVSPNAKLLSKSGLRSFSERVSLWLARRFNTIVPISEAIAKDFCMDRDKCFVFQGGVTDFALKLMQASEQQPLLDIAVFAGSLEPHNGIDRLVDRWIDCEVQWPLHIFGRGSLLEYVKLAAEGSERIVFHDFQPEDVILEWQSKARWNFCLRYSDGLDERYFFPSKLFNISCTSGVVIANDFQGIPDSLREHLCIVANDLSDLPASLATSIEPTQVEKAQMRHQLVMNQYSWGKCIEKIIETQLPA